VIISNEVQQTNLIIQMIQLQHFQFPTFI